YGRLPAGRGVRRRGVSGDTRERGGDDGVRGRGCGPARGGATTGLTGQAGQGDDEVGRRARAVRCDGVNAFRGRKRQRFGRGVVPTAVATASSTQANDRTRRTLGMVASYTGRRGPVNRVRERWTSYIW